MNTDPILYIIPYVPETDGFIEFHLNTVKSLNSLYKNLYCCLIPMKHQKNYLELPFYKSLITTLPKKNIAIYKSSFIDKIANRLRNIFTSGHNQKKQINVSVSFCKLRIFLLTKFSIRIFKVLITHCVWTDNIKSLIRSISNESFIVFHDLLGEWNNFDLLNYTTDYTRIGILSTEEIDYLKKVNLKNFYYFPYILNSHKISDELFNPNLSCGFIGSIHKPNIRAVEQLIDIAKLIPNNINIYICGGVCDLLKNKELPNNIYLLGKLDNLNDFYKSIDVILIPLECGTGVSIKTIEALSYSKTIISTSTGVRGLRMQDREDFILASDNQEFAKSISFININRQELQKYSNNAYEVFCNNYSPEFQVKYLKSLFAYSKNGK